MRIAIISDIHLGDETCIMIEKDAAGNPVRGRGYEALRKALEGKVDYLVLLGDILDFSISSYHDAYDLGKFFFTCLKQDNLASEMIYVPGNHDFDLWHTVEYQVNIINRIANSDYPGSFRMSVPGIIDDRPESARPGFTLRGVAMKDTAAGTKYAGLFMDKITDPPTPFNFAYPNLYLVTSTGESVLVTHGHYMESFWTVLGDMAISATKPDLLNDHGQQITHANQTLKEMVAINFPQCELACSGVGQSGPLTDIVSKVMHEVKRKELKRVGRYIDGVFNYLISGKGAAIRPLLRGILKSVKCWIMRELGKIKNTRYSKEFVEDADVKERFRNFYQASLNEIADLKADGYNLPVPSRVIFGHTHQPIPWNHPSAPHIDIKTGGGTVSLSLFNSGGWIKENGKDFCGAEIFIYETGRGIRSVTVS